ncbi:hypothetical protein BGZ63DRAFT_377233 [Mariannaea sp. PMI_226]|nr:hypothetical protein BGZ63DRAFT_377233 [Mariannaea sp. PMI_226]
MVVWSKELVDVDLLPVQKSEDAGFRSAILTFRTLAGANEAKKMLDGRSNISNDAEMIVEILSGNRDSLRRYSPDAVSAEPPSSASSSSSGTGSHQPSRFNGAFQSLESTSPSSSSAFPGSELSFSDSSTRFQNSFSPHSSLNNYLPDTQRISGKLLIANDSTDDDETTDLINDPIAYAENGAINQRRATAPQLPIGRMAGLSLNTNNPTPTGPSSMPPYMSPMSLHSLSPMNGASSTVPYPMSNSPYRNNFPPVNPADQNPPCNTLYVGNLPVDTSEEELKAMFSKQRGYRRLCFRTKQNGPMCFVEFEDVSFATKALRDLYGQPLHNSVKGGIRLSFSKNPLGVRSGQTPNQNNAAALGAMNGMMPGPPGGFATTNGPPPGLAAPPGFASSRNTYPGSSAMNVGHGQPYTPSTMNTGHSQSFSVVGFPGMTTSAWNGPMFGTPNTPNFPPPHMMRR